MYQSQNTFLVALLLLASACSPATQNPSPNDTKSDDTHHGGMDGMHDMNGMGDMTHNQDGHGNLPAAPTLITPTPWIRSWDMPVLEDHNVDPHIVEVFLTAELSEVEYIPGIKSEVWTYNGTIPGPMLEANVGDQVMVHFKNNLPESTTIHWHGLRVPSTMDGTSAMMTPVPSGGTFEYSFKLLDAGTFWYHPHVRSDVQVEKGLYGGIIVRNPSEPTIKTATEELMLLDDVLLDPVSGALNNATDMRIEMMGKEGNLLLVNGARSNQQRSVRAGEAHRIRVINTANGRYVRLGLSGGTMVRIGGDGGLISTPETVTEVLLVPGERVDVILWANLPNTTAILKTLPYERAIGAGTSDEADLIRFVATSEDPLNPPTLPKILSSHVAPSAAGNVVHTITLGERMSGGSMEFTINGMVHPQVPSLQSTTQTVETWNIVNNTEMDHPFHLHGFFFYRLGTTERKDTVNIPAKQTVSLWVDFEDREGAAGTWMYHCHILEHAERGMMGEVIVK